MVIIFIDHKHSPPLKSLNDFISYGLVKMGEKKGIVGWKPVVVLGTTLSK